MVAGQQSDCQCFDSRLAADNTAAAAERLSQQQRVAAAASGCGGAFAHFVVVLVDADADEAAGE